MVGLTTTYLGLDLKNPLVPSSSPLTGDIGYAKKLEDAGASAIVLPSLFEEDIEHEALNMHRHLDHQAIGFAEADSFLPASREYQSQLDSYLDNIEHYKSALSIPVIGSLNGVTPGGWIGHARELQDAGCDALEINAYYIAANIEETSLQVEQRYVQILEEVKEIVTIPVTMKLSSQFTSPGNFIKRLEKKGAAGAVLFNRFYQPDINLETLEAVPKVHLSTSYESLMRIRWIALLRNRVDLSLAATGGIHSGLDVAKALLVGADVTYLCSVLLHHGVDQLRIIKEELVAWMETNEYESVEQLKGSISYDNAINPAAFERANYREVLDSYKLR